MVLPHLVNLRFQALFHSPPGVLFTFPSRYWFTIGHRRVFSLTGWSPWIPTQFHVLDRTQEHDGRRISFVYGAFTLYGRPFQMRSTRYTLSYSTMSVLQPPCQLPGHGFGLFRVRSPLLTESRLFSFPPGTEMFQFPGLAPLRVTAFLTAGLPHSDIAGSKPVYGSPTLFAANHVLHRQSMPRHPS